MGVPAFFRWIADHFRDLVLSDSYPYPEGLDWLYLDLNCAIHPAVKDDPNLKLAEMYQAVIDYLERIVTFANPLKGIYIAIDGVAPVAKQRQQRLRRYKSVKETKLFNEIKKRHGKESLCRQNPVDFNMISPGTEFMHQLSVRLTNYIRQQRAVGKPWHDLEIHFSDANVPGEGEHKIMAHIRSLKSHQRVAVYGLDADLIFLCAINCPVNAVVLREKVQFEKPATTTGANSDGDSYTYLLVDEMRNTICKIMSPYVSLTELEGLAIFPSLRLKEISHPKMSWYTGSPGDQQRMVLDYSFICFLLGNDFLPHMPSVNIREDGLEALIESYKMATWKLGSFLVNADGETVNIAVFQEILDQLAECEDEVLQQYTEKRDIRIHKFERRLQFIKDPLQQELEDQEYVENKYTDRIKMGLKGWRLRYYRHHFGLVFRYQKEFNQQISEICHNVLEGVKWTLLYYQGKQRNWTWCYRYHTGPSVSDLAKYLATFNFNSYKFEADGPITPFSQLMAILPPESAHLLPPELGRFMSDRDSVVHDLYPLKIEFEIVGRKFLWECPPLLPNVDYERINELVRKLYSHKYQYIPLLRSRNRVGHIKVWKPTPEKHHLSS